MSTETTKYQNSRSEGSKKRVFKKTMSVEPKRKSEAFKERTVIVDTQNAGLQDQAEAISQSPGQK